MKRKAFTLMEVIISCAVLALFMTGVMMLYSSGSKMTNSAMWLQNIASQLKNAARQINMSISKSSYPTKIEFPGKITECKNKDDFYVRYYNTSTTPFYASSASESGTKVLQVTESSPAKIGGSAGKDGLAPVFKYHLYYLKKNGEFVYTRYVDKKVKPSDVTESFSRTVPSGDIEYNATLVRDVESILFENINGKEESESPLKIKITCAMKKNNRTKRSEETVGVPNVKIKAL